MKKAFAFGVASTAGVALAALIAANGAAQAAEPIYVDQGTGWTDAARKDYYSRDQGSRLIPFSWISALKQPNGQPFMADSLSRYGYLPNPASSPMGLPVGFNVADEGGAPTLGMTCSACHTRQIEVEGKAYRIDGGPAIAEFQTFVADLDAAVGEVLNNPQKFALFANEILGPSPSWQDVAKLREDVQAWYLPYHTIMQIALPKDKPWGPSRLDAVSMIFNRLSGLDIGPPPTYLIPENIRKADVPVRYPFLWNAPKQDWTQWPAFSENGNATLGLARNLGEVYGVFATFHPKPNKLFVDYLSDNSANFDGLKALEEDIAKLGAPRWPWDVDHALANAGKQIFERSVKEGGCVECHGIKPGVPRPQPTWATPVCDVGTDSREHGLLGLKIKTGALMGASLPFAPPLQAEDLAFTALSTAVGGTIIQHDLQDVKELPKMLHSLVEKKLTALGKKLEAAKSLLDPEVRRAEEKVEAKVEEVRNIFHPTKSMSQPASKGAAAGPSCPVDTHQATSFSYESRVLEGIWAAAPYLHNGSVPSLAELLKPAAERIGEFKVGPAYDIANVGLAAGQSKFDYTLKTTDCNDRNSGDSRCGHEYGTWLSAEEKKALLEYLKTL
jgi:hypothetical protein